MSLFDLIFKPKEVERAREAREYFRTLTAYRPHFTTWNGSIYESDLVRSAIDARARHISKLKIEIHGAGKPKLQTRLKLQPNAWQTWSQMLYRASTILDMQNTLVICPVYDDYMDVVGYYPILPSRCEVVEYDGEPWLRFKFKDGTYASDKFSNCIVLTKFQYESDFFGSTNHALEPTMKLIHVQNQGIEEAVKNGATFRFMAKLSNFALPSDIKNEAKRFNENNLRSDEDGGLLLFPNTYSDIKQIDSKPYTVSDAENNNIRTSVYNYFAVNEDILQSKAFGDSWAAFYESVIEQFAIMLSEAMTKTIFTEKERQQGSFVMATSNRLQYMSTADKLNVSSQMADRGILSINEIRDIWNLSPIDGGDTRIIRGEYYKANTKLEEVEEERSLEMRSKPKIVAVDFDGTLCRNRYPKIGDANAELIERLKRMKSEGCRLILWSCREGDELREAVEWCEAKDLFFDEVNGNIEERIKKYGYDPRKISADLYIDDKCEKVSA